VRVLLAKGADVNTKTNDGKTVFVVAEEYSHPELVPLLKEAGRKK